jgi:hypothetical protein
MSIPVRVRLLQSPSGDSASKGNTPYSLVSQTYFTPTNFL